MKRTGEMLRKAREAKGISLTEIAMSLKINNKVLTAIEAGDMSKLPAKSFLRGFVQSYAQALKVNSDDIMAVFAEEMGTTVPRPADNKPAETNSVATTVAADIPVKSIPIATPAKTVSTEAPLKSLEEPHRVRTLILTVISVVLLAGIFITKKMIERYQRESVPAEVSVSAPLPTTDSKEAKTDIALPALDVASKPTANTEVVPSNSYFAPIAASLTKSVSAAAPATTLPPTTTTEAVVKVTTTTLAKVVEKPVEKKAEPVAEETAKAATPTTEAPKAASSSKKNLEMIVEALDGVDLEYSSTTGAAQKLHLNADQVHTIRSHNGLKLTVSNGGAVNLILNGKDLGVPGDVGKPVKLTY